MLMGVLEDGKEVEPTCVMGREEPSPRVMRVAVLVGEKEVRLPRLENMCAVAPESMNQSPPPVQVLGVGADCSATRRDGSQGSEAGAEL